MCLVFCLMPYRLVSSDEGKQARRGMKPSGSPRRSITSSMRQACHPVSLIVSASRVVGRLVPCRRCVSCVSSSKQDDGAGHPRVLVSSSCPIIHAEGVPSLVPVVFSVVSSSPHPTSSPASKQDGKRKQDKGKTRGAAGSGEDMAVSTIISLDRIPADNENKQARQE